ncbi:MAG: hypothetical protein Kow0037_16660 [Calditrichia bacterium]
MKNRLLTALLFMLIGLNISALFAGDYLWPTNASQLLTSSFCEFRPRHFHAAIDIKTWNRIGYRVFAIEDGYVSRVRVSAFGYGKAVYLKLKDGRTVVYAHLDRFEPRLAAYVDQYRVENRQYRVDLYLKPTQFPVKKGQLIAYSGRTGIGVPHLHFEIRDEAQRPLNPLQFYPGKIKDSIPPRFYQLAVLPLTPTSLINGQPDTLLLDLGKKSKISLADTVFLSGKNAVALKCWDLAEGAPNLLSFYRAEMRLDDSLIYKIQYDRFSYAETALLELDQNFSLWRKGLGVFHNFYRHPQNKLSHYPGIPVNGGVLDANQLPAGVHQLTINLWDFNGNEAELSVPVAVRKNFRLLPKWSKVAENVVFAGFWSPHPLDTLLVETLLKDADSPQRIQVKTRLSLLRQKQAHSYAYTATIELPESLAVRTVKLRAQTNPHGVSLPLFIDLPTEQQKPMAAPAIRAAVLKNWLRLTIPPDTPKFEALYSRLCYGFPDIISIEQTSKGRVLHVPMESAQKVLAFLRDNGYPVDGRLLAVGSDGRSQIASPDGHLRAEFPPEALYHDVLVFLKADDRFSRLNPFPEGYPQIGKVYDLQPFDQPVKEGVQITLSPPDSLREQRGLGIFYWDAKKGWLFIPSRVDSLNGEWSCRVTSLEKFTMGQDTVPPLLIPLNKRLNGRLQPLKGRLRFTLKDECAGIQRESQIEVLLNGRWHLFEYDPEEDLLIVPVPPGASGTLKISAVDNLGNRVSLKYNI